MGKLDYDPESGLVADTGNTNVYRRRSTLLVSDGFFTDQKYLDDDDDVHGGGDLN